MAKTALQFFLFFGVAIIISSLFSFWRFVHPPHIVGTSTPADFNMPAEEIAFTTSDGVRLSAWFIEPKPRPQAAIIILHGYPAERSDMLNIAKILYPDFTLLLPDLRSFGKSEGTTTFAIHETRDVIAALDELEKRGYEHIGVFGFSMGGAAALMTTTKDERIKAVASYGSYASLRQLGYDLYGFAPGLNYILTELMTWWGYLFLGINAYTQTPESAATQITTPTLLLHSRHDEQIPVSHAEKILNAFPENTDVSFQLYDGSHGFLPPAFDDHTRTFFIQHLQ